MTSTATCITPTKQKSPDPTCTITPTVVTAAAFETPASAKVRRAPVNRAQRIQERKERLGGLQKRAEGRIFFAFDAEHQQLMIFYPADCATITVTDMNTDDYFTTTTTVTGSDSTVTVVCKMSICPLLPDSIPDLTIDYHLATSTIVTTETPAPMTVFSGVSTASTITITAPTPTKTRTVYTNAIVLVTSTRIKTFVYFIPSAPRSCHANLANPQRYGHEYCHSYRVIGRLHANWRNYVLRWLNEDVIFLLLYFS